MILTREQQALKMRLYRERYREKLNTWERAYYHLVKKEPRRQLTFQGRKCRTCEILLSGSLGAYGTKHYCRDCVERGVARKHSQREATRRYRDKHVVPTPRRVYTSRQLARPHKK